MNRDRTAAQLRLDEGCKPHAYKDSLGFLTIGIGHLVDLRKGGGLRPDEIELIFQNDITEKWQELVKRAPWVLRLNEPRQAAVLNMAFQMGVDGLLEFKKTIYHIQNSMWKEAYLAMLDSTWAKQTPARAERVATQMRDGEWL